MIVKYLAVFYRNAKYTVIDIPLSLFYSLKVSYEIQVYTHTHPTKHH